MPADLPPRHHYIPVFYLKQWMAGDGRICEYQREHAGVVKPKRTHPSGTGYVRGLYDLVGIEDANIRDAFEREFLKPVDTGAAEQLQDINTGRKAMNNPYKRSAWTRFLLSLLFRMPEDIALFKSRYVEAWMRVTPDRVKYYNRIHRPGAPKRLEDALSRMNTHDIEHRAMNALIPLITNPRIGEHLINMRWGSLRLPNIGPTLLTSDRPVVISNGLKNEDSHVILPIGPKTIFYAVNSQSVLNFLMIRPPAEIAEALNTAVTHQAVKYVYGQWDNQLPFVQQHMGAKRLPSLLERMEEISASRQFKKRLRKKHP
ncbi:hypothetical protein MBUL_04484 (plasmid) [Methylobacterium bullatum]|uniref:DUF4238 domain-containing protein n=1 Tax=Methylobacterium bullatum TaxID=570505 RepID=A0A679JJ22_9HYPH|nr:hypothetical protein MBUL_04484 [Methylobacterium bullatum]